MQYVCASEKETDDVNEMKKKKDHRLPIQLRKMKHKVMQCSGCHQPQSQLRQKNGKLTQYISDDKIRRKKKKHNASLEIARDKMNWR